MTITVPFSGGCGCGAVRYTCTAPPLSMFKCHCRDCQYASGGAFTCAIVVPADAFSFTQGRPAYHVTRAASGNLHKRGFCSSCGSRLTGGENPEGTTGIVGINAGSLDDPGVFRAEMDIWTSHAQRWDTMDPTIPKFAQQP